MLNFLNELLQSPTKTEDLTALVREYSDCQTKIAALRGCIELVTGRAMNYEDHAAQRGPHLDETFAGLELTRNHAVLRDEVARANHLKSRLDTLGYSPEALETAK